MEADVASAAVTITGDAEVTSIVDDCCDVGVEEVTTEENSDGTAGCCESELGTDSAVVAAEDTLTTF